ncbi:hypothetical protein VOLCADRAFT_118786 [Volvox carteri f. nagariensis]|uniref:CASTOR/POLLUX/SYM8 ion channel conserved domain-containing protein n=1 Tax=Volvox carteri f. nagariensis TaxID=3068 RepID=D8U7F7_VOLCA|nr:uncharacterized protein VOLCADRAFT_118786 [Volvox carteri f. nagariensis]EFJ44227.1 hypothetical protein VOLCADRAFT_118786 [Volvox carteri f. nagariensis]|eukprot:XP_002954586.1 hypothetical protein VOLCADRAFT_118786 [Volvox carteri f. nagariensis]
MPLQMLQYRLMLLFRLPTWGKLVALVCVGLPIVLIGSWLLMKATNMAWGEAAQLTFYVLQSVPGADITRFPQVSARLVLVAVHLLSLYTFATLVGLLTEDVRSNVEEIRCGNFPLPSRDHTVVLDCGVAPGRVVGTLQKILGAREAHGSHVYAGDIAVLSTYPKDELDNMIADVLPKHFGRVVTRHGSPIKVSDLERVAAPHARTVTYVSSASSTSRVAVQCAVQPGLAAVFDAVFCRADDASLRLLELPPELAGRTFAEVRRRFRRAVLCGLLPGAEVSKRSNSSSSSSGNSIILSPPDDRVLEPYDRLLLLAATLGDCTFIGGKTAPEAPQLPPLCRRYDGHRSRPRRLLLLSFDSCLSGPLLAALDEFGAPGCCVTVVSPEPCAGLPSGPTPLNRLVLRNHVGDPLGPGALLGADVAAADAVILSGTEGLPPDEADAVAVGTALLLQRLVADPWVMSCGGAEDVAAAAAVAASIDPDEYWRSAVLAGDGVRGSFSSISSINDDDGESTSESAAAVAAAAAAAPFEQRPPPPSRPLTFVCSIRDPQTRSVLQYIGVEACRTAVRTAVVAAVPGVGGGGAVASRGLNIEIIEPQALISGMLAQVGAEPMIVSALEDLLDEEGYEIYIKRSDRYGIPPYSHVSWSQGKRAEVRDKSYPDGHGCTAGV